MVVVGARRPVANNSQLWPKPEPLLSTPSHRPALPVIWVQVAVAKPFQLVPSYIRTWPAVEAANKEVVAMEAASPRLPVMLPSTELAAT